MSTYVRRHGIKKYLNLTHTVLTPEGLMHTFKAFEESYGIWNQLCVTLLHKHAVWVFRVLVTLSHTQEVRAKMGLYFKVPSGLALEALRG